MANHHAINTALVTAAFLLTNLSGCSSVEGDLKEYMKCGMAAYQLQKKKAESNISNKLSEYVRDHNIQSNARLSSYLRAQIDDELNLDDKNPESRLYTMVKVYNSSNCTKLHEQAKIEVPFTYYLKYIFL